MLLTKGKDVFPKSKVKKSSGIWTKQEWMIERVFAKMRKEFERKKEKNQGPPSSLSRECRMNLLSLLSNDEEQTSFLHMINNSYILLGSLPKWAKTWRKRQKREFLRTLEINLCHLGTNVRFNCINNNKHFGLSDLTID